MSYDTRSKRRATQRRQAPLSFPATPSAPAGDRSAHAPPSSSPLNVSGSGTAETSASTAPRQTVLEQMMVLLSASSSAPQQQQQQQQQQIIDAQEQQQQPCGEAKPSPQPALVQLRIGAQGQIQKDIPPPTSEQVAHKEGEVKIPPTSCEGGDKNVTSPPPSTIHSNAQIPTESTTAKEKDPVAESSQKEATETSQNESQSRKRGRSEEKGPKSKKKGSHKSQGQAKKKSSPRKSTSKKTATKKTRKKSDSDSDFSNTSCVSSASSNESSEYAEDASESSPPQAKKSRKERKIDKKRKPAFHKGSHFSPYPRTKIPNEPLALAFPLWTPKFSSVTEDPLSYFPQALQNSFKFCPREARVVIDPFHSSKQSCSVTKTHTHHFLNACGPVWAMSWCPFTHKAEMQYLAISTHKTRQTQHSVSKTYTGKGIIQLWQIPVTGSEDAKFVFGIAHNADTVWDLHWLPTGGYMEASKNAPPENMGRLGVIAAALSDGSINVYCVPPPESLPAFDESLPLDKRVIMLEPSWTTRLQDQAYIVSLRWSPFSQFYPLLLAGGSDGNVYVWNTAEPCACGPIFQCACSSHGVQGVCWSPLDPLIFAAWGKSSPVVLSIFNTQKPQAPLLSLQLPSTGWGAHIEWSELPQPAVVGASDNGSIIYNSSFISHKNLMSHAVHFFKSGAHYLAYNHRLHLMATCTEDGIIALVPNYKRPKSDSAVHPEGAALILGTLEQETVPPTSSSPCVCDAPDSVAKERCFVFSHTNRELVPTPEESWVTDKMTPLYRVCWNPNEIASNMIACGGFCGLVFVFPVAEQP
ncbi:general transcription factor 3C polypeptide 2 [Pelomyxa schiedti]|nr:general transcription factor 3C polypeptide 2 [Pelomyxa schiedti]